MKLLDEITVSAPLIGQGAERRVYGLSADYVIKLPKNRVQRQGEQSALELEVFLNCPERLKYLLCPVIAYFYNREGIPVLIMQKMQVLDDLTMVKTRQARNRKIRRLKEAGVPKEGRDIRALEIYFEMHEISGYDQVSEDIRELCAVFGLHDKEFFDNYQNWGIDTEESLKFLDYGFRKRGDG